MLREASIIRLVVSVENTWTEFHSTIFIESVIVALTVKASTEDVLVRYILWVRFIAVKKLAMSSFIA